MGLVACSSDGSGSSTSPDKACADLASAFCGKINECAAIFIQQAYGDVTTCSTRVKTSCLNTLSAPGTGITPAKEESCVQAVHGATCDDVVDHNAPTACQAVGGTLAAGAACGDSSQCQSAYCNLGTDGTCGACAAARSASGGPCNRDDDCAYGSVCTMGGATAGTTGGTCTTPVAMGGTCDSTHPCKTTLACKNGTCTTPDAAGVSCMTGSCDAFAGLYCPVGFGSAQVCSMLGFAGPGEACGVINGNLVICSGGGNCQGATLTVAGKCQAPAADGAACDDTAGPTCLPPAVCSSAKVCTVPTPSSCH
jgi:hypothetical protein